MEPMTLDLVEAFSIAVEVHGSQRDKAGEPYLFHVMRVAMAMDTDQERVVAILHDVFEDAGVCVSISLPYAIETEFGVDVIRSLQCLTRMPEEEYSSYIRRVAQDPLAVKVKLADLRDNTDRRRLAKLPPAESARLRSKYYVAMDYLGANGALMPGPERPPDGRVILPRCESVSGEDRCVLPLGHPDNHFGGPGRYWLRSTVASSPDPAPTEQS